MFISNLTPRQKAEIERQTVEQALHRWQKLYAIGRKPRTVTFHCEILATIRAHWPDLGAIVAEVKDEQCVAFAKAVEHYSAARFNGMVNTLRNIIPEMACIPRQRANIVPKDIPTTDEIERLFAALDVAYSGHSGLICRFLAFTGFRINEARNLKWEHVREDHIYAPGEVTKNGKPRCVPFIAGTAEIITRLRKVKTYRHKPRVGFVLPQTVCSKALRYACRLAGLPRYTHHTFRHYFATRCILSGVDIPTVAKWLGHSDNGALLLRIYCHLLDDHSLAMALKVKVLAKGQEVALLPPTQMPSNIVAFPGLPVAAHPVANAPAAVAVPVVATARAFEERRAA